MYSSNGVITCWMDTTVRLSDAALPKITEVEYRSSVQVCFGAALMLPGDRDAIICHAVQIMYSHVQWSERHIRQVINKCTIGWLLRMNVFDDIHNAFNMFAGLISLKYIRYRLCCTGFWCVQLKLVRTTISCLVILNLVLLWRYTCMIIYIFIYIFFFY